MSTLVASHPFLVLFLYVVFCAACGVLIFFSYSFIRKRIQRSQNMRKRVRNNDQSN